MSPVGSPASKLIFLRGNSASGKSTVAAEIRRRYGRGLAIVGQDNLRRVVLREHDIPGGANIGLTEQVIPASTALNDTVQLIMTGTRMLELTAARRRADGRLLGCTHCRA